MKKTWFFLLIALLAVLVGGLIALAEINGNGSNEAATPNNMPAPEVPEAIQGEGGAVLSLDALPDCGYLQREIGVKNDGQRIYGVAYIPDDGAATHPLVICAHGLGGTYRSCAAYAEQLASHGFAAYCFDFRGGGGSMSDGSTTEMSVMTEVSDLEAILRDAANWDFVDANRMVLLGTSQGGIVSAITAARHVDETAGLILCYPAFLVHDSVHQCFSSLDEVPEAYQFEWIMAGRPYAADVWDYDVYAEIGTYNKPVLLMHGNADGVVPISYAERAAELYPDVDYFVIDGAGHGFNGAAFEEAMEHIFDYLTNNDVQSSSSDSEQGIKMSVNGFEGTLTLNDNATARAFSEQFPLELTLNDWDGREYYYPGYLPYDEADVIHSYAPGQLTYWCGGWLTAYYSTNDDTVIEDGSVVIGLMSDNLVQAFAGAKGNSVEVSFEKR